MSAPAEASSNTDDPFKMDASDSPELPSQSESCVGLPQQLNTDNSDLDYYRNRLMDLENEIESHKMVIKFYQHNRPVSDADILTEPLMKNLQLLQAQASDIRG